MLRWRGNGWKNSRGQPVQNRALIERTAAAFERTGSVTEYTRGHATGTDPDTIGSREADTLANQGRETAEQQRSQDKSESPMNVEGGVPGQQRGFHAGNGKDDDTA